MVRALITAILFCSLGAFGQAPRDGGPVAAENAPGPTLESARALAGKGRLDQAMAQLGALAQQTPEPAGVERLRGNILYQREQFTEAIEAFKKAETQDPADTESVEM